YLNPREGKWSHSTPWTQSLPQVTSIAVLDFDKDGWMDVALTHNGAPGITLWRNQNGKSVEQVHLPLQNWQRAWGVAAHDYDNKSAMGTKVEVFAGSLWQKWEISGTGYLSQSATDLVIGLGKERKVDIVRALWPTGVLQDEAQIASNSSRKLNEIDRRGSSCP